MTPGELLTAIMKEKNIGQIELAEAADVAQSSINRMKHDKQNVNYKLLKYLRVKYKININQFFDNK
jgi:transcriptional regulator with XRE-family HTH domain